MSLWAGLDLGTSRTKVGLFDDAGTLIASMASPMHWSTDGPRAEADGREVFGTVVRLLQQVLGDGAEPLAGIGITGMAEVGSLVDGRGRALTPLVAWHDPRGGDALTALPIARRFARHTGLAPSHVPTAAKLLWRRRAKSWPAKSVHWLNLPELIGHWLGGDPRAELTLTGRTGLLDVGTGLPWKDLFDELELPENLLPAILAPGSQWGRVASHLPGRGAVITIAGQDHVVAAAGAAVTTPGTTFDSLGTAEALVAVLDGTPTGDDLAVAVTNGVTVGRHVVDQRWVAVGGLGTGLGWGQVLDAAGITKQDLPGVDREMVQLVSAEGWEDPEVTVSGDGGVGSRAVLSAPTQTDPARIWRAALLHGATSAAAMACSLQGRRPHALAATGGWMNLPGVRLSRQLLAHDVQWVSDTEPTLWASQRMAQWAAASPIGPPPASWFSRPDAAA